MESRGLIGCESEDLLMRLGKADQIIQIIKTTEKVQGETMIETKGGP